MNYAISEELLNKILELKKSMDRVKIDDICFGFIEKTFGQVDIHILNFKEHCEVRVVNERSIKGIYYRILDQFLLKNNEVIYQFTEKDML